MTMNAKCDTTGCGRYARKASESGRSVRCAMHATSIHTVDVKPDLTPAPSFDEICGVAVEAGVSLTPPTREDSHGVRYCPCGKGYIKASSARCSYCSAREVPTMNEYDIECCDCGGDIVTTEGWDSLYGFECLNCGKQRSEPPMTWMREA